MKKEFVLTLFFMGAAFVLAFLTVADCCCVILKTISTRIKEYVDVIIDYVSARVDLIENYIKGLCEKKEVIGFFKFSLAAALLFILTVVAGIAMASLYITSELLKHNAEISSEYVRSRCDILEKYITKL